MPKLTTQVFTAQAQPQYIQKSERLPHSGFDTDDLPVSLILTIPCRDPPLQTALLPAQVVARWIHSNVPARPPVEAERLSPPPPGLSALRPHLLSAERSNPKRWYFETPSRVSPQPASSIRSETARSPKASPRV